MCITISTFMKKKIIISLAIVILVVLCIAVAIIIKKNNKNIDNNTIVAKSKIGNITVKDVKDYLNNIQQLFGQNIDINNLKKEEKELIVNEIVNNKIILETAKKSGVENTEEYKAQVENFKNNLAKELFLNKLISENITEEKIRERYDEVNKILVDKKEYKVKHILVKTKAEIDKVVRELKNNTFEDLAEKYSIDSSKSNGGDLGYVVEGQTVPEFDEVLKNQPLRKLSEPFETQFGWHILIKEDERKATIKDYEEEKELIKDALTRDFIRNYSLKNLEGMNIEILE